MEKLHSPTNLLSHSPPFQISHNPNNTTLHQPLPLFSHTTLPNGGIAFIGGPVSAISFHPNAPGICLTAAHNTTNPTHILHKCYEGPAVIQLWHFSLTPNSPPTKCLGLIPHNGDSTFDLKWRPDNSSNRSPNWYGTFAAALGDGSVIVCHLDKEHVPSIDDVPHATAPSLEPTTIVLRRNNARCPVRVVEWSPDGKRLVVGSANGNVEVYEADSNDACWPSWTIPAQESVISDIRWLNPKLYCTLGMSCVLRLCDVRDPIATLEQNCEGLQGSLSMAMLEPYVAVVGADSGYLRVVRLSAIDQVTAQNPVRRVYLQNSCFRDMRSVSLSGMTVLYTGGSEGILHQVVFPKPLWPLKGACKIDKTRISERLRWRIDGDVAHLHLDPSPPKEKGRKKRGGLVRDSSAPDGPVFGERYKQPIVVTRIAVNAQNNVIAVGIDGGFITWLPINTTAGSHATPVVEEDAHMFSTTHFSMNGHNRQPEETNGDAMPIDPSPSLQNIPFKVKLKKEAKRPVYGPKRRRGRPKKIVTDDTPKTGRREGQTEDDTAAKPDTLDAPMNTGRRRKEARAPAPAEEPRRTGKRGRAGNDDETPAAPAEEVVELPATHGKRKTRKRRRTRASEPSPQEEAPLEAQADQAREETVPSQNTEEDDGVETTPHGTTSRTETPSGSSARRTKARSASREQLADDGVPIPLRLRIRMPAKREASGKKRKLVAEAVQSPQPTRKSRRSRLSAIAPTSDLPAEPDLSTRAPPSDAPAKPDTGSGPSPSVKPSVASPSDRPPPVKLIVPGRADTLSAPATSDVGTTSASKEERRSVLARIRIRKRRADEMSEPDAGDEPAPKRSKTVPQVADHASHVGPVARSGKGPKRSTTIPQVKDQITPADSDAEGEKGAPESEVQEQDATPARSRRVRKPSWRVRGD